MAPERYQSCIQACDMCADACDYCSNACLQEDDVKMMAKCIRLDMDRAANSRMASASHMSIDTRGVRRKPRPLQSP